jgi:hypothetical protein
MLEICIWTAIAMVITLRSLAVYSQHFIGQQQTTLRQNVLGWFRFYKQGFSLTLGLVAFFLAAVAYLDGSLPWTIGNLVFGCAAFINFQKRQWFKPFQVTKGILQSQVGSSIFYWLIPGSLFAFLLGKEMFVPGAVTGRAFSYTGAYLLAVIFLSMKLGVWGEQSHEAWAYLAGVLMWDALLFTGAFLDSNIPFGVLESYALLLDSFTFYLVKSKPLLSPHIYHSTQH